MTMYMDNLLTNPKGIKIASMLKSCRDRYIATTSQQLDQLRKLVLELIDIKPLVNYNAPAPPAFATDGSYACYWQMTHEEGRHLIQRDRYVGAVRVAQIEQQYIHGTGNQQYITVNNTPADELLMIDLENGFDSFPPEKRAEYIRKWQIGDILSEVMSVYEKHCLYEFARTHTGYIIMVDGALVTFGAQRYRVGARRPLPEDLINVVGEELYNTLRHHSTIYDLIDICKTNQHMLVGISKDSNIQYPPIPTMSYTVALEKAMMLERIPFDSMFYIPVNLHPISYDDDPLINQVHMTFAKLHHHAYQWHRVDYADTGFDVMNIMSVLASYSQCNQFYGTPNPPQVAHKSAVQIRRMSDLIRGQIYNLLHAQGFTIHEIEGGLTDVNGKLVNHHSWHDVLDMYV